jgi:methyl-accepting chemotaxis protein
MDQASSAIAGAVERQEQMTREIAANIDEVAREAGAVSATVSKLARSSAMTCAGMVRVIWNSISLKESVDALQEDAVSFLSTVRSSAGSSG